MEYVWSLRVGLFNGTVICALPTESVHQNYDQMKNTEERQKKKIMAHFVHAVARVSIRLCGLSVFARAHAALLFYLQLDMLLINSLQFCAFVLRGNIKLTVDNARHD